MTRTLAVLCALALGASADATLSANDSIPLPRARSDGTGTTVPTEAQAQASAMANWTAALVAHIRAQTSYPELARLSGSEGVAQLFFVLDRKGDLHGVRVLRSSGSLLLDGRSVRLLYEAQPFPPPPDELVGESFRLTLPIRYRLERPESTQPDSAQQNFDRSVADYRQCIAANPNNANACEGLRHIMDANAQVLSGHAHPDR